MNTYKLIMLDNPILVSDEEIKENDFVYRHYPDGGSHIGKSLQKSDNLKKERVFKIIAGIPSLPSIDFSALSEEDCKKIGWVDVERIANELFEPHSSNILSPQYAMRNYFIRGFKAAQFLNEKKYSEEDLRKAFEAGQLDKSNNWYGNDFTQFFQSLSQPKVFQVEVEMENDYEEPVGDILRPKITNNLIKIIKVL